MECVTEDIKNIVELYKATAKGYGESIEEHDYEKASSSFVKNEETFHKLLKLGDQGSQAMFDLLKHNNPHIRISAAKHLLSIYTSEAVMVLKEISVYPGFCGLRARIALEDRKINSRSD